MRNKPVVTQKALNFEAEHNFSNVKIVKTKLVSHLYYSSRVKCTNSKYPQIIFILA